MQRQVSKVFVERLFDGPSNVPSKPNKSQGLGNFHYRDRVGDKGIAMIPVGVSATCDIKR